MIGGATRGAGGTALGHHLARAASNEAVLEQPGRGLIAVGIREQVAELTALGSHARTRTPLYHVHADPPADRPWSQGERADYWERFEAEFGLGDRPYAAVLHVKDGRAHEHRVYLRVRPDGSAIRLDHDYARRERLHRAFEFDRGETLTPGAHSRAVLQALEREGRQDVVRAMQAAGHETAPRPRAPTTPRERMQAERTGIATEALQAVVLLAWEASDSGAAFRAALAEHGLALAWGRKTLQIVDPTGATHDLRRTLSQASRAGGGEGIRVAEIAARIAGLALPTLDALRAARRERAPNAWERVRRPRAMGAPSTIAMPTARRRARQRPRFIRESDIAPGTVVATGDSAPVPPTDWGSPGAVERYLREWAEWWRRGRGQQAAIEARIRAAADREKETRHDRQLDTDQLIAWFRDLLGRAEAEAEHLDGYAHRGDDFGHDAGRYDPACAAYAGQPRDGSGDLRHAAFRKNLGGADRAARPAGGGAGDAARPDDAAAGGDGGSHRAHRAAAARARISARWQSRALANAVARHGGTLDTLTERLRQPGLVARALVALEWEEARIQAVLATRPPDVDRAAMLRMESARIQATVAAQRHALRTAQTRLQDAEASVGVADRLAGAIGLCTDAMRMWAAARDQERHANAACWTPALVREAEQHAEEWVTAALRQRRWEQHVWEQRTDVVHARRDAEANLVGREAIEAGDEDIIQLTLDDLRAARERARRSGDQLEEVARRTQPERAADPLPSRP